MLNFLKRNTDGGGRPPLILLVLAALLMPFVEGYKKLKEKVYRGWEGAIRAVLGGIFGFFGASAAGHYVGWTHAFGWYLWIPAAALGWLAVYCYVWPLLYLGVLHPVWKICDKIYDFTREFTKKSFGPLTAGIVKAISTVCVGSGQAWGRVLSDAHQKTWFVKVLGAVSYISTLAGAGYLGWHTYTLLSALVGLGVIGTIVGIAVGFFVAIMFAGLVWQFIDYGKLPFFAIVAGGAAAYGVAPTAAAHLVGWQFWGALVAVFVLTVGYVFPFVNVLLTNGFLKKIWDGLKPLIEKTYDEKDKAYSEFIHHGVNLLVTAGVSYGAWVMCGSAGLALVPSVVFVAVAAIVSYIGFFKVVDHEGGNAIIGALSSVAAGISAGLAYTHAGLVYGVAGGITSGVIAALAIGFVLLPVVYSLVRAICLAVGISGLGKAMAAVYRAVNAEFKKLVDKLEDLYKVTYRDKTGYQDLFLHVVNIAVAVLAYVGLAHLGASYAVIGTSFVVGSVLALTASIVIPVLSYLLVGKLLFKSGYGLEFVGGVLGLLVAGFVGTEIYAVHAGAAFNIIGAAAAIAAWFAAFLLVVPLGYWVLRLLTSWALLGWLKPLLSTIYDFCWARFANVWDLFIVAYNRLLKPFLRLIGWAFSWVGVVFAPLFRQLAAAWKAMAAAYDRVAAIFRGKRS